jgi:MFS family permease
VFFTGKTLPSLQIALTVSGVGFGLALPPLLAHLIAQVRHQRRTVLLGGYLAIGFLGSVGSNIMAGFVGDTWGIRNLTLAIACVLLAAILLAIPILILSLVSNSEATG